MWGQETIVLNGIRKTGIIPTRVGTRHLRLIRQLKIQDHPHACGDKYDSSLSPVSPKGSSPRVWGQVKEYDSLSYDDRIIPTRVGTSHKLSAAFFRAKDHPHACGDKTRRAKEARPVRGSSPRVWGQVSDIIVSLRTSRIIPTRVGTSNFRNAIVTTCEDHPHACGDKGKRTKMN